MRHSHGKITEIRDHHDGRHATVTVTHGKRKRSKDSGNLDPYSRQSSSMTMPKSHAANYSLGQHVSLGMEPREAGTDDNDGDDDEAEAMPPRAAPVVPAAARVQPPMKSNGKIAKAFAKRKR